MVGSNKGLSVYCSSQEVFHWKEGSGEEKYNNLLNNSGVDQ